MQVELAFTSGHHTPKKLGNLQEVARLRFSAENDILCAQFHTTIRGMTFHGREENGRSGG